MNLFWFNSHVFMLRFACRQWIPVVFLLKFHRMMQVSLFLMVCLISLAIYFSADLLPVNWPPLAMRTCMQSSFWSAPNADLNLVVACAVPIVATPLTVLLLCFSSTVPIYTIIIHVGQLVDLDIVIEARRKGIKKATVCSSLGCLRCPVN